MVARHGDARRDAPHEPNAHVSLHQLEGVAGGSQEAVEGGGEEKPQNGDEGGNQGDEKHAAGNGLAGLLLLAGPQRLGHQRHAATPEAPE